MIPRKLLDDLCLAHRALRLVLLHQLLGLPLRLLPLPLFEAHLDLSLRPLLLLPLEPQPVQLPLQVHLVAVHLVLQLDAKPGAGLLELREVVPQHDMRDVVQPVAPEGEVDEEDEDEDDEFEGVLYLTELPQGRHIHVL